jgi:hypothetical protein
MLRESDGVVAMAAITIGKDYCLRLPDGRALGHVCIARLVDSWAEGPFQPGQGFEEFRGLFEREAHLRREHIIPLWEEVADQIEDLQIQVFEEGKGAIPERVRVFIEGDEAILESSPPVS